MTVPNFLDFTINAVLHPTFIRKLCYKLSSIVIFFYQNCAFFTEWHPRLLDTASKFALFSVSGLKDEKLIKKQTYMETETCKLYSGIFWIFLSNFMKIDRYNFELYRFKVGAFSETQCRPVLKACWPTLLVQISIGHVHTLSLISLCKRGATIAEVMRDHGGGVD